MGQEHITRVLAAALTRGSVPQQVLFTGGSGLGKTTMARILAASLLCLTPPDARDSTLSPCGSCASCLCITSDSESHPDLIEFDAASHGGKDEIREIAARAQLAPMVSSHRVYIIDEAHGLTGQGAQAFLKLLEEPPSHVFFMLCTTDPEKMLSTNRGRCVEFALTYPTRADLIGNLSRVCAERGIETSPAILDAIVDATDPELGVRGTVMTLERVAPLGADEESVGKVLGQPRERAVDEFIRAVALGRRQAWAAMGDLLRDSRPLPIKRSLSRRVRLAIARELEEDKDPGYLVGLYELVSLSEPTSEGLELVALLSAHSREGQDSGSDSETCETTGKTSTTEGHGLPLHILSEEEKVLLEQLSFTREKEALILLVPQSLEPSARACAGAFRAAASRVGMTVGFRVVPDAESAPRLQS